MLGAATLHADTYEEVEADRRSIGQATLIVVVASAGIAAARWLLAVQAGLEGERVAFQVVVSFVEPLALWVGGSAAAFMVGATFFRGPQTESRRRSRDARFVRGSRSRP